MARISSLPLLLAVSLLVHASCQVPVLAQQPLGSSFGAGNPLRPQPGPTAQAPAPPPPAPAGNAGVPYVANLPATNVANQNAGNSGVTNPTPAPIQPQPAPPVAEETSPASADRVTAADIEQRRKQAEEAPDLSEELRGKLAEKPCAVLVRGEDRFGNFNLLSFAKAELDAASVANQRHGMQVYHANYAAEEARHAARFAG